MSHSEVSLCVCRSCLKLSRIGWSVLVKLIVTRCRVSKKNCLRRKPPAAAARGTTLKNKTVTVALKMLLETLACTAYGNSYAMAMLSC